MISRSVENFCDDYWLIENYEEALADTKMWELHHRIEVSDDGLHRVYSSRELMNLGLYFHRPAEELIFLTRTEHRKLHHCTIEWYTAASEKSKNNISFTFAGRTHSDETREKLSDRAKGRHMSEDTRKKMSLAHKGRICKPKPKYKWHDPDGIVHTMSKCHVTRYHPDWKLIEE